MKDLKMYFLSLMVVIGFFACSDDDNFPKPEIDGNSEVTAEVKRDTADSYKIELPIRSEAGLKKITLQDASSKILNEVTTFTNANTYTYTYDLDLTSYTVNTTLMLTLTITDMENQVVSQKITLNIKKFSELDIRFATEGTITSQFKDCNMKLTVVRGMIALNGVNVYVGSTLSDSYDLSLDPLQTKYELNLLVDGLQMGDNTVKVIVVDEKGQKFEKTVTVKRVKAKTWEDLGRCRFTDSKDPYMGGFTMKLNRGYMDGSGDDLEEDKVYRLGFDGGENGEYLDFGYDNSGRVVSFAHSKWEYDYTEWRPLEVSRTVYTYVYNTNGELEKVTRKIDQAAAMDYVTNIIYESGSIKEYMIGGELYKAQYAEKDGEAIRVDKLEKSGQFYTLGEKQVNPLYMSELPAVVPGTVKGIDYSQYLYNKYIFNSVKEGDLVKQSYQVSGILEDPEDSSIIYQTITWTLGESELMFRYSYK